MSANERKLLNEIEECRQEMLELSSKYALNSDAVILISKKLDKLLNKYQQLKSRKMITV